MTEILVLALTLVGAANPEGTRWVAKDVPHEKGALYALSYLGTPSGRGLLNGGAPGFNVDFECPKGQTNESRRVTVYPAEAERQSVALGVWDMPGGAKWRDVRLDRVRAEYNRLANGVELGAGEAVDGNVYRFLRRTYAVQGPHTRPFRGRKSSYFNTSVWRLSAGSELDFEFALKGRRWREFEVDLGVGAYTTGSVSVAVSKDGADWRTIATAAKKGRLHGIVPAGLLPAERLFVRVQGDRPCSLQVGYPSVVARIDGAPFRAAGFTRYVDEASGEVRGEVRAPAYYDEDWGRRIAVKAPGFALWRADEEMRVAPHRRLPKETVSGLGVSAAANEAEAVQLVLKAGPRAVRGVSVGIVGEFRTNDGATIPAAAVDVRQVTYLDIRDVTDETSAPGLWPEPLETQPADGVTVPAGENRPFWVRVKVPKGTPAGRYLGALEVRSAGAESVQVPMGIEVFGFELPDEMTLQTSFGFGRETVFRYHRAKSMEERRLLDGLYLQALSEAHISPYRPLYAVPDWTYRLDAKPGEEKDAVFTFDWKTWDEAMERTLARYHFSSFVLSIPGYSCGSFKKDVPHEFQGRKEGTEAYELLIGKYLKAIQDHLEEKGWLGKAYLYWFDEPLEKHYPWLVRGLRAIRKYAPKIRCGLTEEPVRELVGSVNLWCPTSMNLHSAAEAECQARGDELWWYVCMLPKAPYATEFIDHPGTDLRVWLWQTWKERLTGVLIWETVWWTSSAVYPDSLQNPYEDAACWSAGAKGFRYNWGNGDGRFLYPPRACFAPDGGFVKDAPNGSMRLEILRDGIEDYEYFTILSRLDPSNALLKVPADVTTSLVDFTDRSEPIKAHRRLLAHEIERLLPKTH